MKNLWYGRLVAGCPFEAQLKSAYRFWKSLTLSIAVQLILLALETPSVDAAGSPSAPLVGPSGVTALSGQIVDLNGNGLPGVELRVGAARSSSDDQGRFLLTYVIPGITVLEIDGRHAGSDKRSDYGIYETRVETQPGSTTILPYKSWLPLVDHSQDVSIPSPTTSEIVIRTSSIPDLELHIPAGVVLRDIDNAIVTHVSITAMPADRTPIPLPADFHNDVFFTIQPGVSCLYDARDGVGTATIVLPNTNKELPGARTILWRYEPDFLGWNGYGVGIVSSDGRQVIPEAGSVLTDFSSGECDSKTHLHQRPPQRPRIDPRPR